MRKLKPSFETIVKAALVGCFVVCLAVSGCSNGDGQPGSSDPYYDAPTNYSGPKVEY